MKGKMYKYSINLSKINKKELWETEKGDKLLQGTVFINEDEEENKYGQVGSITQEWNDDGDWEKEYIGNLKPVKKASKKKKVDEPEEEDDLPF